MPPGDLSLSLSYLIFFADPVKGAAAQAANGGSLDVVMSPQHALDFYAPDAVILQVPPFYMHNVPGVFTAGPAYSPPDIDNVADSSRVESTITPGQFTVFFWEGAIYYVPATSPTPPPVPVPDPLAISGKLEIAVVHFTGDGIPNKQISTTFPLDTGVVAVMLQGGVGLGEGINLTNVRITGMTGCAVIGNSTIVAADGITGFNSSGFTVTEGSVAGLHYGNVAGRLYTAVVIRDTTSDNRYLRTSVYAGLGSFFLSMTATTVDPNQAFSLVSGGFQPFDAGLVFVNQATFTSHTFSYIDNGHGIIRPGEPTLGFNNYFYDGAVRPIFVADTLDITHAWIVGRGGMYRGFEMPAGDSVGLAKEAYQLTDAITGFQAIGDFSPAVVLGTQNNVNNNALNYALHTLSLDAVLRGQHLFIGFKGVAAGGGNVSVSGFGFKPDIAYARRLVGASAITGGVWRSSDHAGNVSSWMSASSGVNGLANGIVSIDADGITVGSEIAPTSEDFYGWAFKGGAIVFVPTYLPPGAPPLPQPIPGPSGPPPIIDQPAACVVPVFPNV